MRAPVSLCAPLMIALVGCGDSGRLAVHAARGQVFFEGKPAGQALLVLHPLDGGENTVRPQATVEPDGSFRLNTYESGDGAPAGTYAATVTLWRSPARGRGGPADEAPPANVLPVRYSRPQTSGLQVRIEPGANELPNIELKK